MNDIDSQYPSVATRTEWLARRLELLEQEKALTRQRNALNAERRRLPMVAIDKPYSFACHDRKIRR